LHGGLASEVKQRVVDIKDARQVGDINYAPGEGKGSLRGGLASEDKQRMVDIKDARQVGDIN
jgi:hypothetical protein